MTEGLILFAHGARDPLWSRPFEAVAQRILSRRPDVRVSLAYLEFMSPHLNEAADRLAAEGCTRVAVVPLFLGAGGHVRRDLPLLLEGLRQRHPGVQWLLRSAIGEADSVIEAMAIEAASALQS